MNKLLVVGAGGFGREVMWLLCESENYSKQYDILGFVDDSPELKGKIINGFPIVGNMQWLMDYPQKVAVVVCMGSPQVRQRIVELLKKNINIYYPTIIANNVKYSDFVKFGQGSIICSSSVLTVNIDIGNFVIINLDCTVGHDAVVSDFVTLNPSVNVSGNVYLEECTEVGTGANIIQGKKICKSSVIGAGSVVVKDITESGVYAGVPATLKRRLDKE